MSELAIGLSGGGTGGANLVAARAGLNLYGEWGYASGYVWLTYPTNKVGLGIPTNNADRRLEVFDSADPQLRLTQADNTIYADFQVTSGGDLIISIDGQTNQLVLDGGGNVGIGTTSPQAQLHIENADAVLRIAATGTQGSGQAPLIEFYRVATLRAFIGTEDFNGGSILTGTVGDELAIRSENAIWFGTNGNNTRMVIDALGNVSIGTTSPDRKLEILDASNPQLRLTQIDATIFVDFQVTSAGDLEINMDGQANQLVLDGGGNIGIGLAAPTAKLHIIQTAAADAFRVDDQASDTTPFIIDQNGNVGIGMTSPNEILHVAKAGDGAVVVLLLENSQANAAASTNETSELHFGFGGDNDVARIVVGKENDYTTSALSDSFLAFYTDLNGAVVEAMRIKSNGNVGIGTINPEQPVHVQGSSGETYLMVEDTTQSGGRDIKIGVTTSGNWPAIWLNQASPSVSNYAFLGGGSNNSIFNTPVSTNMEFRVGNLNQFHLTTGLITIFNGVNFVFTTGAGTKFGTQTSQKMGFWNTTPVGQPSTLTAQLTSITHIAPGTPDYALQALVDSGVGSAFGFATKDEGETLLSVVANLQLRLSQLESRLQGPGFIA